MEYKKYNYNSFTIHTIKCDKFKNAQIEVVFRDNINKDEITKRIFLCDLLCENNVNFPTSKSFAREKERLYNTFLFSTTLRIGRAVLSDFCLDFINPKYTDENNLEDLIKLLCDTILKPNIKDKSFDKKTFDNIKERIAQDIDDVSESSTKTAVHKMLEIMDEKAPANIRINGYREDLEKITPEDLYKYYDYFLSHNYCDIFVIGDLDMKQVTKYISKYLKIKTIKNYALELNAPLYNSRKVKTICEKSKFNQSVMVIGADIKELDKQEKNVTAYLFNAIFGGDSLDSKLGASLRQEKSLCYNVSSFYQKYDNMFIIRSQINDDGFKTAVKLIKKELQNMKKGKISDEEFENAKLVIISTLTLNQDDISGILNNYLFNVLDDVPLISDRINAFKKLTKEDVIKVAKKVNLNTIYLLAPSNSKEDQ